MLQITIIMFLIAGNCSGYKAECSSHHAENTFLCMRQNPRGPTPSTTGMDDRYEDEKGDTENRLNKEYDSTQNKVDSKLTKEREELVSSFSIHPTFIIRKRILIIIMAF